MRSLFGLVLLIAGLGLGAYAYFPEAAEEHVRLVQLSRYVMPVAHDDAGSEPASPLLTFSPNSPLFGNTSPDDAATGSDAQSPPIVVARQQLVRPANNADAIIPAFSDATPLTAPQPSPSVLAARALEVQQELRRVGCYYGYLDGDWGPASKRAMQSFLAKVNASLPVDQPDDILLALLRSHPDGACTNACPPGQVEGDKGRCTSSIVYAGNAAGKRDDAPVLIAPPRLAKKNAASASAPAPRSSGDGDSEDSVLLDVPASPGPRAVLPGRMSVGGPLMAHGGAGLTGAQTSALPDLRPAPKNEATMDTAAIILDESTAREDRSPAREVRRPAKTAKKRHAPRKNYSQKSRQKRLMRQAFGEIF